MALLLWLLLTVSVAVRALYIPNDLELPLDKRATAANFYQSTWSDGAAKMNYRSGPDGQYTVTWSGNKGNFVVGKGWQPGGPRSVEYSGTFEPVGNAYLSIYGWTTNPLVEYYIIEYYGTHKPCTNATASDDVKSYGNMTSDGATYEIWTKMRRNKPSIQGTATFPQFWSIRTSKHVGGTVTTGNHYKAWQAAGLRLGGHSYMIVAIEGQDSSGSATITVGVGPKEPSPETPVEGPPPSTASSSSSAATTRSRTSSAATTTKTTSSAAVSVPSTTAAPASTATSGACEPTVTVTVTVTGQKNMGA